MTPPIKVPEVLTSTIELKGSDVESIVNAWVESQGWVLAQRPTVYPNMTALGQNANRDNRTLAMTIDSVDVVIKVLPLVKP